VGAFPGAHVTKTRPAVVLSTEDYHRYRPDVAVGLITTQAPRPLAPTDCQLRDWKQEGLHAASYFRLFPVTLSQREIRLIGRLSDSDWESVRLCFWLGLVAGSSRLLLNPPKRREPGSRHPVPRTVPRTASSLAVYNEDW
jgi:hypothetical protein